MMIYCDGVVLTATVDEAMEFLAKRRELKLPEPIMFQPKLTAATPPGFHDIDPGFGMPVVNGRMIPQGVQELPAGGLIGGHFSRPVPPSDPSIAPLTVGADPNIKLTFNEELGKQLTFPVMPSPTNPHFESPYEHETTHGGVVSWPKLQVGGPQDPTGGKTFK